MNPEYQQYEQDYNAKSSQWRSEPVQNRHCNDVGCTIFFFVVLALFIGFGASYVHSHSGEMKAIDVNFSSQTGVIGVCLALSVVLSFLYVLLIKAMPKCMVYLVMVLTGLLLLGVAIAAIVVGIIPLAIMAIITLLIYGCVLYCLRDKIQIGIVLIKVASTFLSEKWGVFITPVIKILLTVLFSIFWFYSLLCIVDASEIKKMKGQSNAGQSVLIVFWIFVWIFFTLILYYIMVFTIAVACSFWYYRIEDRNFLNTAYKWIFTSSFGSFVFAAALVAIVTVIRMLVDQRRKQKNHIAASICLCLVSCCLQAIEQLLKVLNHNAVIVIAVTGEDYISSAKTTLGLLFKYLGRMVAADTITGLLIFWGVVIISVITGFLSYLWLSNERTVEERVITIIVCVIGSIVASSMVFSVLSEAVSSVFIFYCFDAKHKEMGYGGNNMPAEIIQALANYDQNEN